MTPSAARKYVSDAIERSQNPSRIDMAAILLDLPSIRRNVMSKAQGQPPVIAGAFRCETRVIAGAFRGRNCGVAGANINVSKSQT